MSGGVEDVRVADASGLQSCGQGVTVELGIVARARDRADIHHAGHGVGLKQADEIFERACGVADRQHRRQSFCFGVLSPGADTRRHKRSSACRLQPDGHCVRAFASCRSSLASWIVPNSRIFRARWSACCRLVERIAFLISRISPGLTLKLRNPSPSKNAVYAGLPAISPQMETGLLLALAAEPPDARTSRTAGCSGS